MTGGGHSKPKETKNTSWIKSFKVVRATADTHASCDDRVKVSEVPMAKGHEVCIERPDTLQTKPYVPCWGELQQLGGRVISTWPAVDEWCVNLDTDRHMSILRVCNMYTYMRAGWLHQNLYKDKPKSWVLCKTKKQMKQPIYRMLGTHKPWSPFCLSLWVTHSTTSEMTGVPSMVPFCPHCEGLWTPTKMLHLVNQRPKPWAG